MAPTRPAPAAIDSHAGAVSSHFSCGSPIFSRLSHPAFRVGGFPMASQDIVIAAAARTPVGTFNGAFATLPAHELGKVAIMGALKRANVEPGEVDEVILGQILAAGEGQNPARQAAIHAGVPKE